MKKCSTQYHPSCMVHWWVGGGSLKSKGRDKRLKNSNANLGYELAGFLTEFDDGI